MPDEKKIETYLGDGLYASFDGWQIVLRARREGGEHWVALDPDTIRSLVAFMKKLGWKDE